jgi:hypothetical protein
MRRLLIALDLHRRTVLDCLAILMILGGAVAIGLALSLLYPVSKHEIPGTDVIAAASTSVAVGGILLGIGGSRDDHEMQKIFNAKKRAPKASAN